jgi:hypothetical protein
LKDSLQNKNYEARCFRSYSYDREFKKEFERKYKKRLTKKSLTEYINKAVEASYKESKDNEK